MGGPQVAQFVFRRKAAEVELEQPQPINDPSKYYIYI
jgi:hypothetical protein